MQEGDVEHCITGYKVLNWRACGDVQDVYEVDDFSRKKIIWIPVPDSCWWTAYNMTKTNKVEKISFAFKLPSGSFVLSAGQNINDREVL